MRVLFAYLILFLSVSAYARDLGQWGDVDPIISQWFKTLMQPDNPRVPCCGESDAYWADIVETGPNGDLVAVITDDRDDAPLQRPHVPVGTRIVVPAYKIKWDRGNPTGHIVIFLAPSYGFDGKPDWHVYCYVQNGGV